MLQNRTKGILISILIIFGVILIFGGYFYTISQLETSIKQTQVERAKNSCLLQLTFDWISTDHDWAVKQNDIDEISIEIAKDIIDSVSKPDVKKTERIKNLNGDRTKLVKELQDISEQRAIIRDKLSSGVCNVVPNPKNE